MNVCANITNYLIYFKTINLPRINQIVSRSNSRKDRKLKRQTIDGKIIISQIENLVFRFTIFIKQYSLYALRFALKNCALSFCFILWESIKGVCIRNGWSAIFQHTLCVSLGSFWEENDLDLRSFGLWKSFFSGDHVYHILTGLWWNRGRVESSLSFFIRPKGILFNTLSVNLMAL